MVPADFQGLVFRAQTGQVLQDQFAAVGARAVVSSFNTLYADIEKGQIDAQENTLNNIYTRNLANVQPFLTISDHGYLSYVVLTRAAWWKSLSPPMREALADGLSEASGWVREQAPAMNSEALEKLLAGGRVQVRTLTPDDRTRLRAAFEPVYLGMRGRLGADFLNEVIGAVRGAQ